METGAATRKLSLSTACITPRRARLNLDFETRRRVIFDHWHNCNDLLETAISHLEAAHRDLASHALVAAGLVQAAHVAPEAAKQHAAQAERDGLYQALTKGNLGQTREPRRFPGGALSFLG